MKANRRLLISGHVDKEMKDWIENPVLVDPVFLQPNFAAFEIKFKKVRFCFHENKIRKI